MTTPPLLAEPIVSDHLNRALVNCQTLGRFWVLIREPMPSWFLGRTGTDKSHTAHAIGHVFIHQAPCIVSGRSSIEVCWSCCI